jgi:hypothetical protein
LGASSLVLTYVRTAPTVCLISEAVKGSRGWARLGGIVLVEDAETMLTVCVQLIG